MKKRYILLIMTVITILLIGFYSINLYKNSVEKQPDQDILNDKTDQSNLDKESKDTKGFLQTADRELKGVELSLFNQDKTVVWQLVSEHIRDFNEKGLLKMDSLFIRAENQGKVLNDTSEELYSITASKADYYQDSGRLAISGPVKINNPDWKITAGSLNWSRTENIIEGKGGITFESSFSVVSGNRFSTDMLMDKILVHGDGDNQAHIKYKE